MSHLASNDAPQRPAGRRWLLALVAAALIAYAGLAGFTVLLYVNGRHATRDAAEAVAKAATAKANAAAARAIAEGERTARFAEKRAGVEATHAACVRSIPTLVNVNRFVDATKGGFEDLLTNAKVNHAATPPSNPQYQAQVENIARLQERVDATRKVQFPVPTRKNCDERRKEDLAALRKLQSADRDAPGPKRRPAG